MFRTLASWLGMCMLLGALWPSAVLANGTTKEVYRTTSGPYEIRVSSQPAPPTTGSLHLTVAVLRAGNVEGGLIEETSVWVGAKGPRAGEEPIAVGPYPGMQTLNAYHDFNLAIPRAGEWLFTVRVEGPMGEKTVEVPLQVQEAPPIDTRAAITLAAIVIFSAGYAAWWVRSRRRRRQRTSRTSKE